MNHLSGIIKNSKTYSPEWTDWAKRYLSTVYLETGNYQKTINILTRIENPLNIKGQAPSDNVLLAEAWRLTHLGAAYTMCGQVHQGEEFLAKATSTFRKILPNKFHGIEFKVIMPAIAIIHASKLQFDQAHKTIQESIQLLSKHYATQQHHLSPPAPICEERKKCKDY